MRDSRLRVKICGLRDAATARAAVMAGADALGFIRAPARRQIPAEAIRDILVELRATVEQMPPAVAVFVNATPEQIALDVETSGVDMIQLSGEEEPELLDAIDIPAFKAMRFASGTSVDAARREVSRWLDRSRPARWVIVERHVPGSHGGTGALADWVLARALAVDLPIWLAGGLHPGNVRDAITQVRPVGVDVSSGVETGGAKDTAKIRAFVEAARSAQSAHPAVGTVP